MRRSATGDATRSTAHRFGASATNISRRSTLSITGRVSVSRPKVPGLDSHSHACHSVEISPSIAAASPACLPPPIQGALSISSRLRPQVLGENPHPFCIPSKPEHTIAIPPFLHLFADRHLLVLARFSRGHPSRHYASERPGTFANRGVQG